MDSAKLIAVKEVELDVETEERATAVSYSNFAVQPCSSLPPLSI